jgi:hypothetical protein
VIIWSGWGILVPLIMALALLLAVPFEGDSAKYGLAFSQFVAAAGIWFVGKKLNDKPGRVMIDQETGEALELKTKHSLFFIKMEYWAFVVAAIAVVMALS